MTDIDVKSAHEGTCYCGMWPRSEYGAHCPSCAGIVPEPPGRQYWLGVKETEWLRQHVPVAQWPQGFLEYWLGLRIEGHQPYGEDLYNPGGTWGTGAPSREELASEPSWADRTEPDGDGTRTAPGDAGTGTGPDQDEPAATAPSPHPDVGQALRNEELEVFVEAASGAGIPPDVAAEAWTLIEELHERLGRLQYDWITWLETTGEPAQARQDLDRYRTVIELLKITRLGMDFLTR